MDNAYSAVFLPLVFVASCVCLVKLVQIERLLKERQKGVNGQEARSCPDAARRVPPEMASEGSPSGGDA